MSSAAFMGLDGRACAPPLRGSLAAPQAPWRAWPTRWSEGRERLGRGSVRRYGRRFYLDTVEAWRLAHDRQRDRASAQRAQRRGRDARLLLADRGPVVVCGRDERAVQSDR